MLESHWTSEVIAEMRKLREGAGETSEVKRELVEPVLERLMGGNLKPDCQVRTTAGSLLPFLRSSCDLRMKMIRIRLRTNTMNLEAEEDGWMKNTIQQGRCLGDRNDTCKVFFNFPHISYFSRHTSSQRHRATHRK